MWPHQPENERLLEKETSQANLASSRTSAPEGKEMHKHGQDHRLLPILSIIIDEGLEEPPSCPGLMDLQLVKAKCAQLLALATSKRLLLNQEYIKRGQTRKGETFYGLGSVQFRTTTTSQFVPALLKRSLDMEMRMCGIETTTDEVKADLNAFKTSVPPASTTQATQPHPDRQAQAPSPAHDKSQTQSQSKRQHLITNNQADLDKWCSAEFATQPHPDRQAQAPSPAHDKSQTQGQSQRQHLITNNQADLDKWCRAEFGL
ncbi:hypothetical protein F2Q68_00006816 [Brassica cretica]|uniref:Uncharacterized protein n=1 Tax=Brassica cretica TaxID=69181 RepID=A0A8S9JKV4_BRACR|nr:hypothetical protein F2Q68_00006816 [Brassica cretica]